MKLKRESTIFGKKVKKKLIDLNMKQSELANRLGIREQYLARILNGDRSGKTYLDRIREILGMDKAA